MVGKGLDSYLDQLTEESGSTSLPDILTSLLKPRKPRSVKPSEQEMEDIKQKVINRGHKVQDKSGFPD